MTHLEENQLVRNLVLSYCDLKQTGNKPFNRVCSKLINFDNSIYLYGGADEDRIYGDIYRIDLVKLNWDLLNVSGFIKPNPRYGHSFNKIENELIIFGGFVDDNDNETTAKHPPPPFMPNYSKNWTKLGKLTNEIFIFRPSDASWDLLETFGDVPPPCAFHTSEVIKTRDTYYLLIFGGCLSEDYSEISNDIYILDISNLIWIKINQEGDIPSPRFAHGMVLYNKTGNIFLFGGCEDNNDLYVLDVRPILSNLSPPFSLNWKKLNINGTYPLERKFHSFNLIGDKLFLFGGKTKFLISDLYIYEINNNRWSRPLYQGLINYRAHASTSFFDKLIIFGGCRDKSDKLQNELINDHSKNFITNNLFFLTVLQIKQNSFDEGYKFKLVTVGDSGVGKSSLLTRFVKDYYSEKHYTTLGVDFKSLITMTKGKRCTLQLWDTAGQERFGGVTGNYYRNADGFIIVFDATKRDTFINVDKWIKQIKEFHNCATNCIILLLGNKIDLINNLQVTEEEALACANKINAIYIPTSAKLASNVDPAFLTAVNKLVDIRNNIIKNPQEEQKNEEIVQISSEIENSTETSNCICINRRI